MTRLIDILISLQVQRPIQHTLLHPPPPKSLTARTAENGGTLWSAVDEYRHYIKHSYPEPRTLGSCASLWGWRSSLCSAKWHPLAYKAVSKFTCSKEIIIIHGAVATPIHSCLVFSTRIPCFQLFMITLSVDCSLPVISETEANEKLWKTKALLK